MMMIYGFFVFQLKTLPFNQLSLNKSWRYPTQERIGLPPSTQYLGRDDETISLSGVIYPEITGGMMHLSSLYDMANSGKAWPLISGQGEVQGWYVLTAVSENRSEFFSDGTAKKTEFTLSLKSVSEPESLHAREVLALI